MSRLFELKAYLQHLVYSGGPHSVHSPYVFDLITQVLIPERRFYCFEEIERCRRKLLNCAETVNVNDLGAGSRSDTGDRRRISNIARTALQSAAGAQQLFRLVNHLQPRIVLELGTSLGITTSYLANASSTARVYTIEGSDAIAQKAGTVFKMLGIGNITQLTGDFDEVLPGLLQQWDHLDFVLIDGNHRYEPTLRYFRSVLSKSNEHTVIVLDDIHWSAEMNAAWEEIAQMDSVSLSIDFFHFGVIYLRRGIEKQHFRLKLPG